MKNPAKPNANKGLRSRIYINIESKNHYYYISYEIHKTETKGDEISQLSGDGNTLAGKIEGDSEKFSKGGNGYMDTS
ncbi:hypothetical protein JCM15764A_12710 [Geotalea toluenoxydans]